MIIAVDKARAKGRNIVECYSVCNVRLHTPSA